MFSVVYVQLMILVDGAGGEWPVIGHAPWNGCNLADFVMPFFLFIVGMAIPLSLKVRPSVHPIHVVRLTFIPVRIKSEFDTDQLKAADCCHCFVFVGLTFFLSWDKSRM